MVLFSALWKRTMAGGVMEVNGGTTLQIPVVNKTTDLRFSCHIDRPCLL